jgi:hypothetical protein
MVKREFDLVASMEEDKSTHRVVYKEGKDVYEDMKRKTAKEMETLRESLKQHTSYKEVIHTLGSSTGYVEESQRERKAKKRRVSKGLRQYTTPKRGEKTSKDGLQGRPMICSKYLTS